tara:strand:+ start:364 stop:489 length:126 start_codon:yes stop_codon:yes gene_type:complete
MTKVEICFKLKTNSFVKEIDGKRKIMKINILIIVVKINKYK